MRKVTETNAITVVDAGQMGASYQIPGRQLTIK